MAPRVFKRAPDIVKLSNQQDLRFTMHYEKTYSKMLASLPPRLCENAIQYRQLKKIIKCIVDELSSLGLTPEVLQRQVIAETSTLVHSISGSTQLGIESPVIPKVVYELNDGKSTRIKPQLRIWINIPSATSSRSVNFQSLVVDSNLGEDMVNEKREEAASSLWTWQQRTSSASDPEQTNLAPIRQSAGATIVGQKTVQEVVIPLVQEMEFYDTLTATLESISSRLQVIQSDFLFSLRSLSGSISGSIHPVSAASTFHPHSSLTADAGAIRVKVPKLTSDLYSWREIFQLYLETEVFNSVGECTRGERSVDESEKRLQLFVERLNQRGFGDGKQFKMKQSAQALTTFLSLNLFILNVKKFSFGSAEATRKILKKHARRTALPLLTSSTISVSSTSQPQALVSYATTFKSLSRTLVQAIGETLIPIIPYIDDYSCLICTNIAFKPIRLTCGHVFCVRCLVKMQKRNKELCPLCRAPSVLTANKNNVDWGMLNFMQDWFPLEAKEKLSSNEREATAEQLEELRINPSCLLM